MHNPMHVRLPPEPLQPNDPLQRLKLLIEISATVRRRVKKQSEDLNIVEGEGSTHMGKLRKGPTLAAELKKKNANIGYRSR